ncbi:hypothetical protein F5B19DRAFT_397056 [Rostrohypoxylon terebratum]|nr:hypothetical protein F5B19DRAFT_397056 [Rostrohypoxylon terebratum]
MCTGVCWDWHCRVCCTIIVRDMHVSGYTCKEARRAGKKGRCRTGVEYSRFSKLSADMCALCETAAEIAMIDAFTSETGGSEDRVGYYIPTGNDGYEEIQKYTLEQLKEWDEWEEPLSSDEEESDDDDDGDDEEEEEEEEEYDCFSGTTYSVAEAFITDDETDIDDDDDEDGGVKLQPKNEQTIAEAKEKCVTWASTGSSLWRSKAWSIWNRSVAHDMFMYGI